MSVGFKLDLSPYPMTKRKKRSGHARLSLYIRTVFTQFVMHCGTIQKVFFLEIISTVPQPQTVRHEHLLLQFEILLFHMQFCTLNMHVCILKVFCLIAHMHFNSFYM